MESKELIKKWVKGSLTKKELEEFERTPEFSRLNNALETLNKFKSPEYDLESELEKLKKAKTKTSKTKTLLLPVLKIAASVIIIVGLTYLFNTTKPKGMVQISSVETSEITLPDESWIILNKGSFALYNEDEWDTERKVVLNGEGYFEVSEGSVFEVETSMGSIKVLGTSFNVRNRDEVLEVSCYSGMVSVTSNQMETYLSQGQKVLFSNSFSTGKVLMTDKKPSWIDGTTTFESAAFYQVVNELERQYDQTILVEDIDTMSVFTGAFTNSNLDMALKSVTLPLNLEYRIAPEYVLLFKPEP